MEIKTYITLFILTNILLSFCISVSDVHAIVPEIQEVVFINSGENTIMNVTFYHTPVTAFHHVDQVEVDIDGTITSYPISQSSTTFTAQINLGQINGEPSARTRVHCTVDGWSSWSNQQDIPEFPSWMIIPLFLLGTFLAITRKKEILQKS